ncbi:MAG TPA: hypothetical protein VN894_21060 [Polyangiaceae bacterium]|nr:hypothetical protein [Polyangiaceae bacterium]
MRLRFIVFLACGAVACGPSFQAVYECDVHFEHCYAIDESPVPSDAKKECWRGWLRGYTYGQSSDRVQYAATRFSQLSLGPTLPSEEPREARPRRAAPAVATPVPTSAFAPPPSLAAAGVPPAQPPAPAPAARAPVADCSDACVRHWTACRDGCDGPASVPPGRGRGACDECDRGYRACVPACFR